MKNIKYRFAYLLLLSLFVWGCSSDLNHLANDSANPNGGDKNDDTYLTLNVAVPNLATRQVEEDSSADSSIQSAESLLEHLDVLVFEEKKDGEYFAYHTEGTPKSSSTTSDVKSFEVRVKRSTNEEKYRLVAIGNIREAVNSVLTHYAEEIDNAIPIKKKDFIEKLEFEVNKPWDADKQGIPLWGETRATYAIYPSTTGQLFGTIQMLRSMASIGVYLADGLSNFKIKEVYVYNPISKALVAPRMILKNGKWVQERPSLPKDLGELKKTSDSAYPRFHFEAQEGSSLLDQIYIPEAINEDKEHLEKVCLVVGGFYGENNDKLSWYRVDFAPYFLNENDPTSTTTDIVRNHFYQITVNSVKSSGYNEPDEAFEAEGTSMEAHVKPWNLEEIDNLVFDGKYYLKINPKEMNFDGNARVVLNDNKTVLKDPNTFPLVIETDHPAEVRVEVVSDKETVRPDVSWITVTKQSSTDNKYVYGVSVEKYEESRYAYLKISIGETRLITYLRVNQSNEFNKKPWIKIEELVGNQWVETSTIYFHANNEGVAASNRYKISWGPRSNDLDLMVIHKKPSDAINWGENPPRSGAIPNFLPESDNDPSYDNVSPEVNYNNYYYTQELTPNALPADKITLTDQYLYMLDYNGQTLSKVLTFVQSKPNTQIEVAQDVILMDGKTKYLVVKSSVPWTLWLTENHTMGLAARGQLTPAVQSINNKRVDDKALTASDKPIPILSGEANYPRGKQITLVPLDDINTEKLVSSSGGSIIDNLNAGTMKLVVKEQGEEAEDFTKKATVATYNITLSTGYSQKGLEANCYVMSPYSKAGVLIPVRAANLEMYDAESNLFGKLSIPTKDDLKDNQIGADTELFPKLIWTDVEMKGSGQSRASIPAIHYHKDNLIKFLGVVGKGKDAYLLVRPGEAAREGGNAVVAITNASGTVLWSWHIWITDLAFEKGQTMQNIVSAYHGDLKKQWLDRDLGALSPYHITGTDSPSNPYANKHDRLTANYYQWGRKDPVPRAGQFPVVSIIETYTSTPRTVEVLGSEDTKGVNRSAAPQIAIGTGSGGRVESLLKTVQHPENFYNSSVGCWYKDEKADFWNNQTKSIFDPCPAGYRVPAKDYTFTLTHIYGNKEKEHIEEFTYVVNKETLVAGIEEKTAGNVFPELGRYLGDDKFGINLYKSVKVSRWMANRNTAPFQGSHAIQTIYDNPLDRKQILERNIESKKSGVTIRCVRSLKASVEK